MTSRSIGTALVTVLLLVPGAPASAQQAKCLAGKTGCMAKKAAGLLKCEALAETPGRPVDPNTKDCVTKVETRFGTGLVTAKGCFEKLESKVPNDCPTVDNTGAAETAVDACVAAIVAAIDPLPLDQTKCGAGRKKCASKYLAGLLKCRRLAQTPGKPADPNTKGCVDKAMAKYTGGAEAAKGCFAKLEAKNPNDCQSTTDSPTVKTLAEDCVDDLVAVIMTTTTLTTSTTTITVPATTSTTSTPTTTTTPTQCTVSAECDDADPCTTDICSPLSRQCENLPMTCDDHNVCTYDNCVNGACNFTLRTDCNDNIACTADTCLDGIGCVFTPIDDFCESADPCFVPRCASVGCVNEPLNCDDDNPCTTDSCFLGECQHQPHNFCDDGLRCTRDICVQDPTDATRVSCNCAVDLSTCGSVPSCAQAQCGQGKDCTVVFFDDRCPVSPITCLAPVCTANGCGFRDTCGPTSPGCEGCAQCSCLQTANKC